MIHNNKKLLSIITACFNEEKVIETFYIKLCSVLNKLNYNFEIIFVNDGGTDKSLEIFKTLSSKDNRLKIINLSRNFGQQHAIFAGIEYAKGDGLVLIDCDLEDDPEYIKLFIDLWEKGYEVIYAKKSKRKVAWIKRICFSLFHWLNYMFSDIRIDCSGIFCLMDKKVANHLRNLKEINIYLPGLRQWIGFNQVGIEIKRNQRYDKRPRVSIFRLFRLALDSFTSFSSVPLKVSFFLGFTFSIMSFLGILVVLYLKLFTNLAILGWASIISLLLLIGGIQLICAGLQGEYISRILDEVKSRPKYIIKDTLGFEEKQNELKNTN